MKLQQIVFLAITFRVLSHLHLVCSREQIIVYRAKNVRHPQQFTPPTL